MNIDWSKAPDWAQALGKKTYPNGDKSIAWINGDGYNFNVKMGKNAKCHFFNDKTACADFEVVEFRPGRIVQPWSGEGLPPVGTVCERKVGFDGWQVTTICGHSPDGKSFAAYYDDELAGWGTVFRPIPTPEQIAAEEKEKAIAQMMQCFDSISDRLMPTSNKYLETLFGALHDANFRKQVTP